MLTIVPLEAITDGLPGALHGHALAKGLDPVLGHRRRAVTPLVSTTSVLLTFTCTSTHISGVPIGPGATALHRTPFSPTIWLLSARMNAMIAPFVAV